MPDPSIKGASISTLIEDIAKMRDSGRIPTALLEQRLTVADRELLDEPVNPAGWYPIHSYRRLAELICEVEGRREDLLRERGAAAAKRLAAAGIYQQIDSVTRVKQVQEMSQAAHFEDYGRGLRLITTLSASMFNFTSFEVQIDPEFADRYCIVVPDGHDMPDVLMYTTEGFINAMAELGSPSPHSNGPAWTGERTGELVRYRMNDSI
jgi:hypothetical protein